MLVFWAIKIGRVVNEVKKENLNIIPEINIAFIFLDIPKLVQ